MIDFFKIFFCKKEKALYRRELELITYTLDKIGSNWRKDINAVILIRRAAIIAAKKK